VNNQSSVLVVEDDPDDILLLTLAFRKASLPWRIIHVVSGKDAVKCLSGSGPYGNRDVYPPPRLVLLDIKMPLFDGFDFLEWKQQQPDLRGLPVVIISSSGQQVDRERALRLGAREYHVKPADQEKFTELLLGLHERWLNSHQAPPAPPSTGQS
jgi:CheY-like chemotaxis protein